MRDHSLADDRVLDLAKFERQRHRDMALLRHRLTDEELARLAVMISEAFGPQPYFRAFFDLREGAETALRTFPRSFAEGIRLVVHPPDGIAHCHVAVLLNCASLGKLLAALWRLLLILAGSSKFTRGSRLT
jgi:hypothetical protein